jgi:ubiquinone/menaquinone biosynthesis C-methylase UbiE
VLNGKPAYRDWTDLAYRPAVAAHYPDRLIGELPRNARVLEVGCNEGIVSCHVAERCTGATVHGIDLNPSAIEMARQRAAGQQLANVTFGVADVTAFDGDYDAVIASRVLTCFPHAEEWDALLGAIVRLLLPGGRVWIVDYRFDPGNPAYAARYEAGEREGFRRGSFRVATPANRPLFIAHHHTEEEIACLVRRFTNVHFRRFESLSMNGNRAAMFEMLGTRNETMR